MQIFIKILVLLTISLTAIANDSRKVIYGKDDRLDLYEVRNPKLRSFAKSTAAMVDISFLTKTGQDTIGLFREVSLEEGLNVCSSEKFSEQPLAAQCSGFLVGEDTLVTAGHCYDGDAQEACQGAVWIFDYAMEEKDYVNTDSISMENVFACKKVIKVKLNEREDFAVIKLDRKTNRKPLKFRTEGKVSDNAKLVVIGHPSMLPTKVSPNGKVLINKDPYQFTTTLDTFQGNSGSVVMDMRTGLVEGILVSGKTDYIPSIPNDENSCLIVNKCDENGRNCTGNDYGSIAIPGENVTRITSLKSYL